MNFKKLEILGFKSFADKLEVKFDSGITGIVGPNGCGKSNVADSIRWVLGEQSAKLLRGSNMMDVIFNGTEKRKALSYCEVSLFFDNTTRLFPVEYDEIVISRKLYRSGESEYSLNRSVCRLKDITELLRDGGIGREGYSIIGQGRIDELLSAKPEDRRAIFEEACGISKFKARRTETERKLARTHDNLVRLNDILSEIERQVEPLERQAENAKAYLELKEQLKLHETNNYICQYESINSIKKAIEDRLSGIAEEEVVRQREYDKSVSEYQQHIENINNIDNDISKLRNSQLSITVGIEKQAGEVKLLKERISILTEQNIQLQAEFLQHSAESEEYGQQLSRINDGKEQKQQLHDELLLKSDELSSQFINIVRQISEGEDDAEESQRMVIESIQRLSDIKSNLSALLAEKNVLSDKAAEQRIKKASIESAILQNTKTESDERQNHEQLVLKRDEAAQRRSIAAEQYNSAVALQRSTTAKISAGQSEISSLKTKLNYLTQSKENFDGYHGSVKTLLNHAAKDKRLSALVEGAVGQLIGVSDEYETAIDVALGQAMQNIVTRSQNDAKTLINYLKDNRLGRVTFLPMDAIKPRDMDARTLNSARGCAGFLGVASSLITYDSKYYNIISGLLGKTIICDNLDNAVQISRAISYSAKIVTLEGDIIHPFGAMTGGSKKSVVSNLLGYDREIAAASEQIQQLQNEQQGLDGQCKKAELLAEQLYAKINEYSEAQKSFEVDIAKTGEKLDKATSVNIQLTADRADIDAELARIAARIEFIDSESATADELEGKISRQRDGADGNRAEQRERYEKLSKARDRLHEQTTSVKIQLASLQAEMSADRENSVRISARLETLTRDIGAAKKRIDDNTAAIELAKSSISNVNYDSVDASELSAIKEKLDNLDGFKYELQRKMHEADKLKTQLSSELHRISESRIREESLQTKVENDLQSMKERIWEEYEITYETALDYRVEDYDFTKSNAEIQKLKRKISALGYVNVNAIEDYKTLKERHDELFTQISDLDKAEKDLRIIIDDLTVEMLARFTKGFNDINANFTKVFKELFGGGNAKLVLDTAEIDDPLSAGIEIVAEPPGKKLQSISLLSGGERALTAIAILFAILKLRPMPFCVLDEIEAALDEANAMRFAKYLKNFSKETQFIVITHRKPTMELSDSLYGVTMQEKGVSKIVSVRLSEALSQVAPPA